VIPVVVAKLNKAACKEAGRRFSKRRGGCTERCGSKLLTFNKETKRCAPAEEVVEVIEEKVEEILNEKCGEGKVFDEAAKNCVDVEIEEREFPDIDLDKKSCSRAGLRFSKKRNSCYIRCKKSETKVFDQE